jgi:hypothetical protein
VFTCPDGSEEVVICTGFGAAAIVRVKAFVAVCAVGEVESVTLAVKVNEPDAVGVPEMLPVPAFSVIPAGRAPELMLQL